MRPLSYYSSMILIVCQETKAVIILMQWNDNNNKDKITRTKYIFIICAYEFYNLTVVF